MISPTAVKTYCSLYPTVPGTGTEAASWDTRRVRHNKPCKELLSGTALLQHLGGEAQDPRAERDRQTARSRRLHGSQAGAGTGDREETSR